MAAAAIALGASRGVQPDPQKLSYLDKIIDKKVTGIALSCIERVVHCFLSMFSCFNSGYNIRLKEQLSRIHLFDQDNFEGAKLQDLTAKKVAQIGNKPMFYGEGTPPVRCEAILLRQCQVNFTGRGDTAVGFGDRFNTKLVTVKDLAEPAGHVVITEHTKTGDTNIWTVDLGKVYELEVQADAPGVRVHIPMYLPEEIIADRGDEYVLAAPGRYRLPV